MRRRDSDRATFESLYRANADDLLIWFTRRTLDQDASLDLVAETFALAYEGRGRINSKDLDSAARWLWGIAKNQLQRYWRKGRAARRASQRLGLERPELTQEDRSELAQAAGMSELREILEGAMGGLSQTQQKAIRLRVIEDRPYEEIGEELGLRADAVRARVSRGLRKLQRELEQSGVTSEQLAEMEAS